MKLTFERRHEILWISGCVTDNSTHAHHAMQIVWAEPGTLAHVATPTCEFYAEALLIEGNHPHILTLPSGTIALIEAQSALAVFLRQSFLLHAPCVPIEISSERNDRTLDTLFDTLSNACENPSHFRGDLRVRRVLRWLHLLEEEGRWEDVSLRGALDVAHLSRSRFLHLFTENVGTPWRAYLVWRRALIAAEIALHGNSLTEAAHAVGYADAAHMSRQFRALFGYAPSKPLRGSTFVQAD